MITVPDAFCTAVLRFKRPGTRAWLASLPQLVAALSERWGLVVDGPSLHGGLSLVVPVRRGEERCMLKLALIHSDAVAEAEALAVWAGCSAVRLLEVDRSAGALLLERLESGRSLGVLGGPEAFTVIGGLLRRLAVPAPANVSRLRVVAQRLVGELPSRWEELGRPFSERLLEATCATAVTLGPSAKRLLVHCDLHDANVLAGEREPWVAIDPKVVAGDPEYGVGPLLWRRIDQLNSRTELQRHLGLLCEAGGLEPERACGWALVRCVDYWLWGLSVGLTEDPARCARLAAWLEQQ